jgi:hypothetical protein
MTPCLLFSAPIRGNISVLGRAIHSRANLALTFKSCRANILFPSQTRSLACNFSNTSRQINSHSAFLILNRPEISNIEKSISFGHHRTPRALLSIRRLEIRLGRAKLGVRADDGLPARYPVCAANGRSVRGCSPRQWGADERLSALPGLWRGWHIGAHLAGAAEPAGGSRHAGMGAGLPVRQCRLRGKREAASGGRSPERLASHDRCRRPRCADRAAGRERTSPLKQLTEPTLTAVKVHQRGGRPLQTGPSDRQRWEVKHCFGWMDNSRWLVVRYERPVEH